MVRKVFLVIAVLGLLIFASANIGYSGDQPEPKRIFLRNGNVLECRHFFLSHDWSTVGVSWLNYMKGEETLLVPLSEVDVEKTFEAHIVSEYYDGMKARQDRKRSEELIEKAQKSYEGNLLVSTPYLTKEHIEVSDFTVRREMGKMQGFARITNHGPTATAGFYFVALDADGHVLRKTQIRTHSLDTGETELCSSRVHISEWEVPLIAEWRITRIYTNVEKTAIYTDR